MATAENAEPRQLRGLVAELYPRWTLDVVVRLVEEGIAIDFVKRPRQYKEVPPDIAEILENFWFRSGTDPGFPNLQKREMILFPILGQSDGVLGEHTSEFHMVSTALRGAATAFTTRVFDTGEENLRQAFRDAAITFRSYLRPFEDNAAVANGKRQIRNMFDGAVRVLLNRQVTGVFGRPPADTANWPLGSSFDENGALVIKYVSEALETTMGPVSKSQFIVMQRIADFGERTIRGLLEADFDTAGPIDELIQFTYRWYTALMELRSMGITTGNMPTRSMEMSSKEIPMRSIAMRTRGA